jgi:hypothetical protein
MADEKSIEVLGDQACDSAFRLMQILGCMEELSKPSGPSWPAPLAYMAWETAEAVMAYQSAVQQRLALLPSPEISS